MKIAIRSLSYKREKVKSFDFFGNLLKVYVCETEIDGYKANNKDYSENFIPMPNGIQGNVARVRNYILDDVFKQGYDVCCIVDDDISSIGYYEGNEKKILEQKEILSFLEKYSILCKEFGYKLWGINLNNDKQCYKEYTPFSTVSCILGPFSCHFSDSEIRYDESLPLKEDYDLAITHLNKYRGILRVNKYHYVCAQSNIKGGCAIYRNIEREKEQLLLLQKKWGSKIVRFDNNDRSHRGIKRKVLDYNPVIKCPIAGV